MENKSNILIYVLVAVLFVGGIGGAYYVGKLRAENKALKTGGGSPTAGQPTPTQPEDTSALAKNVAPVSEEDHVRGNRNAQIALIEYSDYQCPFCQRFHSTAAQALEEYSDNLMWVYRHFPLDALHPQARYAAQASECVADLAGNDAFWTYTDSIFENQDQVTSEEAVDEYALASGIDQAAYENCVESDETVAKVEADETNGTESGVRGTPGVIILNTETGETEVLPGAVPITQVRAAVDSLLGN